MQEQRWSTTCRKDVSSSNFEETVRVEDSSEKGDMIDMINFLISLVRLPLNTLIMFINTYHVYFIQRRKSKKYSKHEIDDLVV